MGEYREHLAGIGFLSYGRSGDTERVYVDPEKGLIREITLETGTLYRDYARGDRRDVILRPRTIHVTTGLQEIGMPRPRR